MAETIPPELMAELRAKTQLKVSGLYKRFAATRHERNGLITLNQAAAIVAAQQGIKLERFYSPEFISGLAQLPHSTATSGPQRPHRQTSPSLSREVAIRLPSAVSESIPYIDVATASNARRMAGVYPIFFLFENSVRNLVQSRMDGGAGVGWWDEPERVPIEVKKLVKTRQGLEAKRRWLDRVGAREIFYTDMDDLRRIIVSGKNWTSIFKDVFPDQYFVESMFNEMEALRNIVAHNNSLTAENSDRLVSNFRHWKRQVRLV